jgi:hypothetical protein
MSGTMKDVYITLDIDWAPDAAIDATAEILEAAGCAATWFVTHETPALERLRQRDDLFELGIHPNFLPGSSHGSEPAEVLSNVLAIVPEARCIRTHAAYQTGPVLKMLHDFPQLRLDCSVMLPGLQHAAVVPYGDGKEVFWRIPYFWADDYEAEMSSPDWALDSRFAVPGVKVLGFHPIHIALNLARAESYTELKARAPDFREWTREQLLDARNDGAGAAELLKGIAEEIGGDTDHLSALVPD